MGRRAYDMAEAGLLDEIQISIMPLLHGGGLRLFEHIDIEHVELEKTRVIKSPTRTDIRFRVVK
jgi:dihydrofolate reductase